MNEAEKNKTEDSRLRGSPFLEPDEEVALLGALSRGVGRKCTEREAQRVMEWAEQTRTGEQLLRGALEGQFTIGINAQGELVFNSATSAKCIEVGNNANEGNSSASTP